MQNRYQNDWTERSLFYNCRMKTAREEGLEEGRKEERKESNYFYNV